MESTTNKQTTTTLVLNESEARWLNALMQNPLSNNPDPQYEDPEDQKIRHAFFRATQVQ